MTCHRPWTAFALVCLLFLSACKKHNEAGGTPGSPPTPPVAPTGPFVYIGGLIDSNSTYYGVYWKTSLSAAGSTGQTNILAVHKVVPGISRVSSIVTSGSDVYLAGTSTNGIGEYWKNDSAIVVQNMSSIAYVALSGPNISGVGFDNSFRLAYSVNAQEYSPIDNSLPTGASTIVPSGIAWLGNSVYTTANVFFLPRPTDTVQYGSSGIYWENSNPTLLTEGGAGGIFYNSTSAIATSGSDVYIAGNEISPNDSVVWCGYWKNGARVTLDSSLYLVTRQYANATGLAISGTDVYVIGSQVQATNGTSQAVYWKNGILQPLSGGSAASAIVIYGSDIYILGNDSGGNTVLWKNGAPLLSFGPITATCMAIGN